MITYYIVYIGRFGDAVTGWSYPTYNTADHGEKAIVLATDYAEVLTNTTGKYHFITAIQEL
jgi:hypothetical protein